MPRLLGEGEKDCPAFHKAAMNQAVSRLYLYESQNPQAPGGAHAVA